MSIINVFEVEIMLQIYEKAGKGQRKCLDFSLSFQSGRASTILAKGQILR
jgi:hypothetical protein